MQLRSFGVCGRRGGKLLAERVIFTPTKKSSQAGHFVARACGLRVRGCPLPEPLKKKRRRRGGGTESESEQGPPLARARGRARDREPHGNKKERHTRPQRVREAERTDRQTDRGPLSWAEEEEKEPAGLEDLDFSQCWVKQNGYETHGRAGCSIIVERPDSPSGGYSG